jgi:hypothetical protein
MAQPNAIDRVKRGIEKAFNDLLDLFGEEIGVLDSIDTEKKVYALLDREYQRLDEGSGSISKRVNITVQFLSEDIGNHGINKIRITGTGTDFSIENKSTIDNNKDTGIVTLECYVVY